MDGYVTAAKLKDTYLGIGVKQETLLKLVRTAQRRVCQESRTQQGAGDIHPLSDGLQPYPRIPTPYLQA